MRTIIIVVCGLVLFASCKKKGTDGPANIVTVIDNGATYSINTNVSCSISKTDSISTFNLQANSISTFPVSLHISKASGPANSIGNYKLFALDTISVINNPPHPAAYVTEPNASSFTETFSGGENYTVDSAVVNITTADGTTVLGSFQLWLSNSSGSKTVTGNINCTAAQIN